MEIRKNVSIPEDYINQKGRLSIKHEEESIVWLWAFPDLSHWQNRVEWLFSPVVGNKPWAGDLWGLDNKGNLLIIEAKNCRTQPKSNPFEDFENLLKSHDSFPEEFTSNKLRQKWDGLLKNELKFSNCYDKRPKGKTKGIIPRSNHRNHIRRWQNIAKLIDKRIRSDSYKNTIDCFLKKRRNRDNPIPHFFGLLVRDKSTYFGLNEKGLQKKQELCNRVKKKHVHLYEACAERKEKNNLVLYIKPCDILGTARKTV